MSSLAPLMTSSASLVPRAWNDLTRHLTSEIGSRMNPLTTPWNQPRITGVNYLLGLIDRSLVIVNIKRVTRDMGIDMTCPCGRSLAGLGGILKDGLAARSRHGSADVKRGITNEQEDETMVPSIYATSSLDMDSSSSRGGGSSSRGSSSSSSSSSSSMGSSSRGRGISS